MNRFRFQTDDTGGFDELVIHDLLHIEHMGRGTLDVHFGDVHVTVWRDKAGVHVRHNEGVLLGKTEEPPVRPTSPKPLTCAFVLSGLRCSSAPVKGLTMCRLHQPRPVRRGR